MYGIAFSFFLAIDKFVTGRWVTAIDYSSMQFSIRLALATALTTRLSSSSMAVFSWQHSITRGCTAQRQCAIERSYRFAENDAGVSHVATNLSSEEAFVAPIDTKVSVDTIVQ
jgi:hypothetical protein